MQKQISNKISWNIQSNLNQKLHHTPDDLDGDRSGELRPAFPVVLLEGILQGDDVELAEPALVQLTQLVTGKLNRQDEGWY